MYPRCRVLSTFVEAVCDYRKICPCEITEQFKRPEVIHQSSMTFIIECAEEFFLLNVFGSAFDAGVPRFATLLLSHSFKPRDATALLSGVHSILTLVAKAKLGFAAVVDVAVDVVYLLTRFCIHHDSMKEVGLALRTSLYPDGGLPNWIAQTVASPAVGGQSWRIFSVDTNEALVVEL